MKNKRTWRDLSGYDIHISCLNTASLCRGRRICLVVTEGRKGSDQYHIFVMNVVAGKHSLTGDKWHCLCE